MNFQNNILDHAIIDLKRFHSKIEQFLLYNPNSLEVHVGYIVTNPHTQYCML